MATPSKKAKEDKANKEKAVKEEAVEQATVLARRALQILEDNDEMLDLVMDKAIQVAAVGGLEMSDDPTADEENLFSRIEDEVWRLYILQLTQMLLARVSSFDVETIHSL